MHDAMPGDLRVVPLADRATRDPQHPTRALLRNWTKVCIGNFIGAGVLVGLVCHVIHRRRRGAQQDAWRIGSAR